MADTNNKKTDLSKEEKMLAARRGNDNTKQDRALKPSTEEDELKAKKHLKAGFFSRIPAIIRAILVKYWFSAAVFFFLGFGLVNVARDNYGLIAAIGLVIGLMTDLIITPFLNICDGVKKDACKYNLFDFKKTAALKVLNIVLNLIYALVLSFGVSFIYVGINLWINAAKGFDAGTVTFTAEPFLFGLFYTVIDLIVLLSRNLTIKIIKTIKNGGTQSV